MRPSVIALLFIALASPVFAFCAPPAAVGPVPDEIAAQTDALICQQNDLEAMADAQARDTQLQSELQSQQIQIEAELRAQQQQELATLELQQP